MVDIENLVIDTISKALKASTSYANTFVTSEYIDTPSSFPCVSIFEADNSSYRKTQDNDLKDHHVHVMYEVNVYSNKTKGSKTEAKKIMDIVDTAFINIKFNRTFRNPIPNKDKTIYRIVARYEAVIGDYQTINGNKVYQVYRE
jgi:hypothetical protein